MITKAWRIFEIEKWSFYVDLFFTPDRYKLGGDVCREGEGWIELCLHLGVWEFQFCYHKYQ